MTIELRIASSESRRSRATQENCHAAHSPPVAENDAGYATAFPSVQASASRMGPEFPWRPGLAVNDAVAIGGRGSLVAPGVDAPSAAGHADLRERIDEPDPLEQLARPPAPRSAAARRPDTRAAARDTRRSSAPNSASRRARRNPRSSNVETGPGRTRQRRERQRSAVALGSWRSSLPRACAIFVRPYSTRRGPPWPLHGPNHAGFGLRAREERADGICRASRARSSRATVRPFWMLATHRSTVPRTAPCSARSVRVVRQAREALPTAARRDPSPRSARPRAGARPPTICSARHACARATQSAKPGALSDAGAERGAGIRQGRVPEADLDPRARLLRRCRSPSRSPRCVCLLPAESAATFFSQGGGRLRQTVRRSAFDLRTLERAHGTSSDRTSRRSAIIFAPTFAIVR
jgi:hypothetical protein